MNKKQIVKKNRKKHKETLSCI